MSRDIGGALAAVGILAVALSGCLGQSICGDRAAPLVAHITNGTEHAETFSLEVRDANGALIASPRIAVGANSSATTEALAHQEGQYQLFVSAAGLGANATLNVSPCAAGARIELGAYGLYIYPIVA